MPERTKKFGFYVYKKFIKFKHYHNMNILFLQSSRPCTKRVSSSNEEVPFKRLKIKDKTSSVNIALWRDLSMTNVQSGSYVRLVNFNRTSTYDKKTKGQKPVKANMTGSSIEVSIQH